MFDPYYKWLGIPPVEQPPHHYRLLGVNLFEADLDVIEGAADRLMSFVRQYQSGENAADAAKILNELALARLCLLKPDKKAAYDSQLRKTLATKAPAPQAEPDDLSLPMVSSDGPSIPRSSKRRKKKKSTLGFDVDPKLAIGGIVVVGALVILMTSRTAPRVAPPNETSQNDKNSSKAVTQGSPPETKSSPITVAPQTPATQENKPTKTSADPVAQTQRTRLPFEWEDPAPASETTGSPTNALASIDLTQDIVGNWTQSNGAWIGSTHGRIYLPPMPSDNYQLQCTVRRLERTGPFAIGFMMAGQFGVLALDWQGSSVSGLFVDGQPPATNCTGRRGGLFQGQTAATIVLTVRPNRVTATFDGETVVDWSGDPRRLFVPADWGVFCRETPFLGMGEATYEIQKAELLAVKPVETTRVAHYEKPVDLIPMFDLKRDTFEGSWTLADRSITSPAQKARVYLPSIVPREYTLSMKVEIPPETTSDYGFVIGVVGGDSTFHFSITSRESGLEIIDGKRFNNNETTLQGSRLKPGIAAQFDCTVTENRVRLEIDGKPIIDWAGDFRRCLPTEDWSMSDGRRLFLGARQVTTFRDITLGPPIAPPEKPKHPAISPGESFDLLTIVDPARDTRGGTWERVGSSLQCRGDAMFNLLGIPFDVPEEYKLKLRVARSDGGARNNEVLYLALPSAQNKVLVMIDGSGSTASLAQIDNEVHFTKPPSPVIPPGTTREIVATVRRKGLQIQVEGKTVLDWKGDPARWRVMPNCVTAGPNISLGSWNQGFRFEAISIEPLAKSSHFPEPGAVPDDGKLLPLVNLERDTWLGTWRLDSKGLFSPAEKFPRLQFPVVPPDSYAFDLTIERKQGTQDLFLGLPLGGMPCIVGFDGDRGKIAGIDFLDARRCFERANISSHGYRSFLFPENKAVRARCRVLPDAIVVTCDNKQVVAWHGDPRRLIVARYTYPEVDLKQPWVGSYESSFSFRNVELKPLDKATAQRIRESFHGVTPKTPQYDVPFPTVDER